MSSTKQIVQIAKDIAAAILFLSASGLIWVFCHQLVLLGIVVALAVDSAVGCLLLIEKKFTLSDIKDCGGIISLIALLIITLYIGDVTKYRTMYSIVFGVLGVIDTVCVVLQLTGLSNIYTDLIYKANVENDIELALNRKIELD